MSRFEFDSYVPSYAAAPAPAPYVPPQAAPASSGVNWAGLDWGSGASLAPLTLANGYYGSPFKESVRPQVESLQQSLATSPQNAALMASLGFQGNPFSGDSWTDDARQFLADRGYTVAVGHAPGTKAGGRAEYYGLMGPDGKYVAGQGDPRAITSDTLMDQITPFLMTLPAVNGIIGAAGAAGASAAPTLTAAESVAPLGSAWSPEALGLTGGITPGVSAAELAGLSEGIPGLGSIGTLGGGATGVSSLGSALSPQGLGLTGGITPGVSAADLAGLSQPLPGAVSGAASSVGSFKPSDNYGQGMTGAQTSAYDNVLNATGSKGLADMAGTAVGGISDVLSPISNLVGGGSNLASIVGGLLGAASSQSGTSTQSRDPWSAAQPYLKGLLGDADAMRQNLAQHPFTPQQTSAYQNAYSGLDQARAALPGLLNWGQSAMQRQSTVPSYDQLFSQVKPR